MLGFAWLTIRQAEEALKNGRLDEAQRLLADPAAQGHKRSWELLQQVAQGYVARGERHLRHDDASAAWHDLLAAEQVAGGDDATASLRQTLSRQGIEEIRALLGAGEPERAAEAVGHLQNRGVRHAELQTLDEMARAWKQAREHAQRGEFARALSTMERVGRHSAVRGEVLDRFLIDLERNHQAFTELLVQMHEASEKRRWNEVVQLAERALALAPNHEEARRARARAWKAIEPPTIADARPPVAANRTAEPPRQRFLLWIDGVGGYLVCLENRVTLGQATPEANVDIPLFADVSRLHATLTRESEGYLVEAGRALKVNGQPATTKLLRNGDRVTLGSSCQLQFRQPVPVSTSARLDLVSGHRLTLAVDGVLLMADTLVLGPGENVHVAMPDLERTIVLFRQKEGLGVRCVGDFTVNGDRYRDRAGIGYQAAVAGDDFALAIEPVGTRMGRT
jgi:hypothetical protein